MLDKSDLDEFAAQLDGGVYWVTWSIEHFKRKKSILNLWTVKHGERKKPFSDLKNACDFAALVCESGGCDISVTNDFLEEYDWEGICMIPPSIAKLVTAGHITSDGLGAVFLGGSSNKQVSDDNPAEWWVYRRDINGKRRVVRTFTEVDEAIDFDRCLTTLEIASRERRFPPMHQLHNAVRN